MESIAKIHWGVMSKLPGMQEFANRHKDPAQGAKPEKKVADPGSLQALVDALKTDVANDNRVSWAEQAKADQGTVMFGGIGAGARSANYWDGPASVPPVKTPARSGSTMAPMRDAADAHSAAASQQGAAASAQIEAATALSLAARELTSSASQIKAAGGNGGGESSLAGMLEAMG
jgi:hypothetical protein